MAAAPAAEAAPADGGGDAAAYWVNDDDFENAG
jgi:hypothetical protein